MRGIADKFRETLERTRRAVQNTLDPKDPEYITLLEELQRLLAKKNIEELTADEMKADMEELERIRKEAERMNHADNMLTAKYEGDVKFMRTHKRIMSNPPPIADAPTVHKILMSVKEQTDELISHNENILENQAYFIKSLQPYIIMACKKENTTVNLQQVRFIDNCISQEYFAERNWAS